ncbi:3-dehydroquinate dehydratase [Betaproteobacteria bacterium SCGC AG-212-J23]|nr:3-dehydroquinate dehydratase [Betaproteobacteria bacterium SCGC AG-212-J23]
MSSGAPVKPIRIRGAPAAGGRLPLLCAPLVAASRDGLLAEAAAAVAAQCDIVEWRVDFFGEIGNTAAVVEAGTALRAVLGGMPVLFTRRSAAEGGEPVPISEAAVLELYDEICASGCVDLVDYEMSNGAASVKAVRDASRRHGVGLVCSYHNFDATPPLPALAAEFRRAQAMEADVAKVSVMARAQGDVLALLAATQQASRELEPALIAVSMGPHGALSRVIGFAFGSALTFGVASGASAPGQLPIAELRTGIEAARKALGS